ncbi:MAG: hypothetical protein ACJ71Y_20855 [Blastococcus sp.]|jgi:hypothetical protein
MPAWATFMPLPDAQGYGERPGSPLLVSEMESGPPQVRARSRAVVGILQCRFLLDQATDALFEAWHATTLLGGVLPIDDFPHPRRKVPVKATWLVNDLHREEGPDPMYIWLVADKITVFS